MPPKGIFREAKQGIRNVRRALAADTKGDFTATQSQIAAIFGNLSTGAAGAGARLTAAQSRELGAIQRLVARGRKAGAKVTAAEEQIVNRFGTAIGPAARTELGPARATAAATRIGTQAAGAAGGLLAQGGRQALAIQAGAAEEAASAAEYATAVALKSRFQADASVVAQMQQDLALRKLDYRLAAQAAENQAALDWKYRELELEKIASLERDEREGGAELHTGITQAALSASDSFVSMQKAFNQKLENGEYPDAVQVADQYIASRGIQDPNEVAFVRAIARSMYNAGAGPTSPGQLFGVGTSDEQRQEMVMDSIQETIMALYPNYRDQGETIRNYLEATASSQFSLEAAGLIRAAGGEKGALDVEKLGFFDRYFNPFTGTPIGPNPRIA